LALPFFNYSADNEEGLWSNCQGLVSLQIPSLVMSIWFSSCYVFSMTFTCAVFCSLLVYCSKREVNKKVLKVPSIEQKVKFSLALFENVNVNLKKVIHFDVIMWRCSLLLFANDKILFCDYLNLICLWIAF
jgi:hypothetical protein